MDTKRAEPGDANLKNAISTNTAARKFLLQTSQANVPSQELSQCERSFHSETRRTLTSSSNRAAKITVHSRLCDELFLYTRADNQNLVLRAVFHGSLLNLQSSGRLSPALDVCQEPHLSSSSCLEHRKSNMHTTSILVHFCLPNMRRRLCARQSYTWRDRCRKKVALRTPLPHIST